jgi:hypothetical protein
MTVISEVLLDRICIALFFFLNVNTLCADEASNENSLNTKFPVYLVIGSITRWRRGAAAQNNDMEVEVWAVTYYRIAASCRCRTPNLTYR